MMFDGICRCEKCLRRAERDPGWQEYVKEVTRKERRGRRHIIKLNDLKGRML